MKLTNRSEYALVALALLSRHYGKGLLSAEQIAETQGIPKRFLQQILFALKRGGFVRAVKGQVGGYTLAREPDEISVADIVRFFEGALAPTTSVSKNFYESSPIEKERGMVKLLAGIRDSIAEKLEATTLAEVSGVRPRKR